MSKITIVTAFFDIGRENFEKFPRSKQQYLDYFRFWARIRNDMIVFCAPENEKTISEIRDAYGLKEKTQIVAIEDVFSIEPGLYGRMLAIEKDEAYQNFRYRYHDPSNYADYNYVVDLKGYFLMRAAELTQGESLMAWIDFGYNHGGQFYTHSADFDFLLSGEFPDKVTMFCLNDPDKLSLIDSLQFQYDCFNGMVTILPQKLCAFFWSELKEAWQSLLNIGCMDDDQQLDLMVYKRNRELFEITVCKWYEAFLFISDQKFQTRSQPPVKKPCLTKRIGSKLKALTKKKSGRRRLGKETAGFLGRMEAKAIRYYH